MLGAYRYQLNLERRHHLHRDGAHLQAFQPELTDQQLQVLDLLGLPPTAYTQQP